MTARAPLGRGLLAALAAVALAFVLGAYSNSFNNEFHFDDSHVVQNNLFIRSTGNIPLFFRYATTFSSQPLNATYRPLVSTTLAIDYWLGGGLNPRQFHLSQLAMLIALCAMLWAFACRAFAQDGPRAWGTVAALFAATLFAAHTANTETMNAISARSELLSTMGVLGSFLVYLAFPSLQRTYLFVLPMVIGALAKTPAVIFAPLFITWVYLFEQKRSVADLLTPAGRKSAGAALLKGLPVLAIGLVTFVAVESQNAPTATWGGGDRIAYLYTQAFAWLHYARLFFIPIGLTADTDWRLITEWYDTRVMAGLLFIALLVRMLWTTSATPAWRPVTFGLAWFILALLPASSIVPLAEVVNEHRVFFPYVGACLAAAWAAGVWLERWADRGGAAVPAACVAAPLVLAAFAGGAYERNKAWRTEESLWKDVTEKSPMNGRGWMNYGLTQMSAGRFPEAKALFDRALQYTPNYPTLEVNLGIVEDRLGDIAAAERHFNRALQLDANYQGGHLFYGRWLLEKSRAADAAPYLRRAAELSPADPQARYLLMSALSRTGQTEQLKQVAADTLKLVPGDPTATRYLEGKGESAATAKTDAEKTYEDWLNQSLRLYQTSDYRGSLDAARKALALQETAAAYNNVAAAHLGMTQWDEAIVALTQALRLDPSLQIAKNNLKWAESEKAKLAK